VGAGDGHASFALHHLSQPFSALGDRDTPATGLFYFWIVAWHGGRDDDHLGTA
jgi:hypothetical protein